VDNPSTLGKGRQLAIREAERLSAASLATTDPLARVVEQRIASDNRGSVSTALTRARPGLRGFRVDGSHSSCNRPWWRWKPIWGLADRAGLTCFFKQFDDENCVPTSLPGNAHRHLMTIRLRLPGGTLKIKRRDELRRREQKRLVPVWQIGSHFLVWWPNTMSDKPRKSPGSDQ
jgi:hypothetical protein